MNVPTKETITALLGAWIEQRPGLDPRNYGDWRSYRNEAASITRDLHDARVMLRRVELSGITAEALASAFRDAYSGRLSLIQRGDGAWALDYCTGQYWPTEFRRAACAVLSSALWAHRRDEAMPAPEYGVTCYDDSGERLPATSKRWSDKGEAEHYASTVAKERHPWVTEFYAGQLAGDWLRASFRREYGRRIADRWFN